MLKPHPHLHWWVNVPLFIALVVGVGYSFWPFEAAKRQVRGFCEALPVGASMAEVKAQAEVRGYTVSSLDGGGVVVDDESSRGRRRCVLQFGATGLASSRFSDGQ
jgi:hypothetical protein